MKIPPRKSQTVELPRIATQGWRATCHVRARAAAIGYVNATAALQAFRSPRLARVMMRAEARNASAMMVMVGCPRPEVTRLLPSQRKRFLTSCVWWSALITDVLGSLPMRQVPSRCTPNCCSPIGKVHFCFAPAVSSHPKGAVRQPVRQLDVVGMVPIGKAQRRQPPRVFQIGIDVETVVRHRQRRAMAEDLERTGEIVCERSLEILAPARRIGRHPAECKTDRRHVKARVHSAAAVESDLLHIELVEVVQDTADR